MPLSTLQSICSEYEGGTSILVKDASCILDCMIFGEVCKYYSNYCDLFPHWRELRNRAYLYLYVSTLSGIIYEVCTVYILLCISGIA